MNITPTEYQTLFNELKIANLSISRLKSANAELLKTFNQQKQSQQSLENEMLVHDQKDLQDRQLLFAENKLAFDQIAKLQFELQESSCLNFKISTENRILLDELEKLKAEKSQMEKDLNEKLLSNTLEKQKVELEKEYAVRRASFFQKQLETQEAEFELFAEKIKNLNFEIQYH